MDDGTIKNLLVVKGGLLLFWHPVVTHDALLKGNGFTGYVCVLSLIPILTLRWVLPRYGLQNPWAVSLVLKQSHQLLWWLVKVAVGIGVLLYGDTALPEVAWFQSGWVKDQRQKKESRLESPWSPGEATKPVWEPLMNCLLMKGQRQGAREIGQRDALSKLFGLLKGNVSALSELGPWTCGAASFRGHLALILLQFFKLPWGSGPCLC